MFKISISKIKIMSSTLSNKIAAGEVVDRPASAIKELVENAIDADATKISIVLSQSGKELMQVVDNGEGMSEEDLHLAFKRHATSKIQTIQDLEAIDTLGFRGEALPSIASVSQVEIKSKRKDDSLATVLRLEGGNLTNETKSAAPVGTNISIKNLFFNTPARRNFLKSDAAEIQQIIKVLKKFFLSYPNIDFEIISNNEKLYELKSRGIEERAQEVFGKELFPDLLKVNESLGGIELSGFISKPDNVRRSRGNQYIFLNGRPIQDKALNHAIFQGYGNSISSGEFPTFCLFLEMDPKIVDVNVHPSKMEVRFSNEKSLYYFFLSSIRKTLNEENVIPDLSHSTDESDITSIIKNTDKNEIAEELRHRSKFISRDTSNQLSLAYVNPDNRVSTEADWEQIANFQDNVEVRFWQVHKRYIFSEIKSGVVIIDQHVAHERILYEKILNTFKNGAKAYGQQLLFPHTLNLAVEDLLIIKNISELLNKIGFNIREFSGNTIVIDAIPVDVKVGREGQIVLDIIDYYKENPLKEFDPYEKLAAAFSCKNAIKSGEVLSQAQMHSLVDQLFACETPYFCPHGRPVIVTNDLDELDRKFKRIT
jgi:DNA mismatch repair protein MutL